jgi:hypothetical protein
MSHCKVVAQYHFKWGKVCEIQNCLHEALAITVREDILAADGETCTIVGATISTFRQLMGGCKPGEFSNPNTGERVS